MDDQVLQDTEYANTPCKTKCICLAYFEKHNLI